MSKNVAMFVDVANLYYAARGQDVDVDYVALLKHATKGRDLIRAYAYSGLDPENENQRKFIDFLGKHGYKVVHKDIRKFGDGRVKANLDIELVVDLFRLADRMDIAVIVSGDGDFAPAIRALQDQGVRCEVISFKPNTSSDLIAVADEFLDIMKIAGIGRKKGEGSREAAMSMPEMPAKEVVPEFGFRDASPAVAAAALAAIRGGEPRGAGARSRRGRRPAEPAATPASASAAIGPGEAGAEDGSRRRRRRRGGRGRGRGRRGLETAAEAATAAAVAPGEIALDELEDLDLMEGLDEEREYTFQEADEATLRELGLLDGGAADAAQPEPAEAPEVSEAKPRRTSRGPRAATAAGATKGDEPPKPRRRRATARATGSEVAVEGAAATAKPRRRRSGAATAAAEAPTGASDAEPKPRRRRAARSTAAAEGGAAEGGAASGEEASDAQPEGIWGRLRSGRSGRQR